MSSTCLSKEDATTILTLASALRRIRMERSKSPLEAVDQLTACFNSRMFSFSNEEEKVQFLFSTSKQQDSDVLTENVSSQFTSCSSSSASRGSVPRGAKRVKASSSKIAAKNSGKVALTNKKTVKGSSATGEHVSSPDEVEAFDAEFAKKEARLAAATASEGSGIKSANRTEQRSTRKRVADQVQPANKRSRNTPLGKL